MTKYDIANQMINSLNSDDFREHVQKHFVSEEEAAQIRSLSGRSFSIFSSKFDWEPVINALTNWAEDADSLYKKILVQTEDVKEYKFSFNTKSVCGKIFPAAGRETETTRFTLFFVVFRNVRCGKVDYELRLKTVYPTK